MPDTKPSDETTDTTPAMSYNDCATVAAELAVRCRKHEKAREDAVNQLAQAESRLPGLRKQQLIHETLLACQVAAAQAVSEGTRRNETCAAEEEQAREELAKTRGELTKLIETTIPDLKSRVVGLNAIIAAVRAAELEATGRAVALFDAETVALEEADKERRQG